MLGCIRCHIPSHTDTIAVVRRLPGSFLGLIGSNPVAPTHSERRVARCYIRSHMVTVAVGRRLPDSGLGLIGSNPVAPTDPETYAWLVFSMLSKGVG